MSNTPTSSEDLYWRLHGLSKILEGSGFIDESRNPDAYTTILDAMAFVRSTPQPVVGEPLSDEQIDDLIAAKHFHEGYELISSVKVLINWYRLGLRDGERAHGIKQGGQHGTDT